MICEECKKETKNPEKIILETGCGIARAETCSFCGALYWNHNNERIHNSTMTEKSYFIKGSVYNIGVDETDGYLVSTPSI